MKRSYESLNLSPYLPNEIYEHLYRFCSAETRGALSLVDKARLEICSLSARALCLLPPIKWQKNTESIYLDLIKRFPHIQKLTVETCRKGATTNNLTQLQALINFLKNSTTHPFKNVTEMNLQELQYNRPQKALNKSLNLSYLQSFCHCNLKSLIWRPFKTVAALSDQELQPVLENTKKLKHFQLHGYLLDSDQTFTFHNQLELKSALFNSHPLNSETLNSLGKCPNLKTLTLRGYHSHEYIAPIFLNHNWSLERLFLHSNCVDFEITKNMPHLKSLVLIGSTLSNPEKLGINCPNLKELQIKLTKLNYMQLSKLTEIEELIKKNCPNLDLNHSEQSHGRNVLTFYSSVNGFPKSLLDLEVIL